MGGGLMQLVAYGAQDIYLTGNPQITFFKVVYRRHTNFAMESIQQTFNGSADFGNKVTATISRNGDLVHSMWVQATVPAVVGTTTQAVWQSNVGHRLLKEVEVEVGGQKIDKHYSDWLEVWSQLTVPTEKTSGYDSMVDQTDLTNSTFAAVTTADTTEAGAASTNDVTVAQDDGIDLGIGDFSIQFDTDANNDISAVGTAITFANAKINDARNGDANVANGSTAAFANGVLTITLKGTVNGVVNQPLLTTAGVAATITVSRNAVTDKYQIAFSGAVTDSSSAAKQLHVPLQFWFCRNPGLALPLIALQYHEVKVNLTFETYANCKTSVNGTSSASLSNVALWVDYIYLDTDERRRFAQVSHEYLIEQLQFTGDETGKTVAALRLNFNHPVKELVWVGTTSNAGVYSGNLSNAKLQLNGHDRFAERPGDYFNKVQPYQHHTNIPSGNVYVYSFALKPEEHQPSGTCNFSRIDNATLQQTWSSAPTNIKVFAVNYNVLRVMSGMGGLAYSN
jgi:hypothetical protein